jgi:hypothetical protein
VKGYTNFQSLRWAADSRSGFVAAFSSGFNQLLNVGMNGNTRMIWRQSPGIFAMAGTPSPDGRRIALQGNSGDANVWMIEGL